MIGGGPALKRKFCIKWSYNGSAGSAAASSL